MLQEGGGGGWGYALTVDSMAYCCVGSRDWGLHSQEWGSMWGLARKGKRKGELCVEALKGWDEGVHVGGVVMITGRPEATVHNIVSTSSIVSDTQSSIDLQGLADTLPCSTYDRKKFAAITIRINNPRCTALLFVSGKLVVTGVRSWHECLFCALCVCRLVTAALGEEAGVFRVSNCHIQNIVAHSMVRLGPYQKLNIQRMYEVLSLDCTYQKCMFPGLIYRRKDTSVVVLCFYSGKIVLTGGKSLQSVGKEWGEVWQIIRRFVG